MSEKDVLLSPSGQSLVNKFANREVAIGVVGLGYVGLPLAVVLAEAGYQVVGIDYDPEKLAHIRNGESYVEDVPSEQLAALLERKLISPEDMDLVTIVDDPDEVARIIKRTVIL